MPQSAQLSRSEAVWLSLQAQGLGLERPEAKARPLGAPALRKVMTTVGTVQLDAVNVLERTQFLVPFSRLGAYDRSAFLNLTGPGRPWFEYWGHAASLLPVDMHPLLRWRMKRFRDDLVDSPTAQQRRRQWRAAHAAYMATVLAEVAERGPLAASELSEPRRRVGEWWDRRSDGRRVLELLFADGVLAAWRSASFERVYDLAERVIPLEVLDLPTPDEHEAQRRLLERAAGCMGVATVADLADYFWMRPKAAAPRVAELVEEGRLVPLSVGGWRQAAFTLPSARPRPPARLSATLLSPFDSLIWARERAERLFAIRYRVEIYVPEPQRAFGYYVLPLLLGEQIVARFDLKSDRRGSALNVVAAHLEPGQRATAVAGPAVAELHRLRSFLGLSELAISGRGDLAPALAKAGRQP